jgi:hypothetical protein
MGARLVLLAGQNGDNLFWPRDSSESAAFFSPAAAGTAGKALYPAAPPCFPHFFLFFARRPRATLPVLGIFTKRVGI